MDNKQERGDRGVVYCPVFDALFLTCKVDSFLLPVASRMEQFQNKVIHTSVDVFFFFPSNIMLSEYFPFSYLDNI